MTHTISNPSRDNHTAEPLAIVVKSGVQAGSASFNHNAIVVKSGVRS